MILVSNIVTFENILLKDSNLSLNFVSVNAEKLMECIFALLDEIVSKIFQVSDKTCHHFEYLVTKFEFISKYINNLQSCIDSMI